MITIDVFTEGEVWCAPGELASSVSVPDDAILDIRSTDPTPPKIHGHPPWNGRRLYSIVGDFTYRVFPVGRMIGRNNAQ